MLDGAICRPHAAGYPASFERRAGRSGTAHQPVGVSDDQFSVCAQIDKKRKVRRIGHACNQDVGDHVAADVARYAGQGQQQPPRVDLDPYFSRPYYRRHHRTRHIRFAADVRRIESQKKMDHGCVAGANDIGDIVKPDLGVHDEPCDQIVYIVYDQVAQLFQPLIRS